MTLVIIRFAGLFRGTRGSIPFRMASIYDDDRDCQHFLDLLGDIVGAARVLRASHRRLSEAVRRGENTGWYAEQD